MTIELIEQPVKAYPAVQRARAEMDFPLLRHLGSIGARRNAERLRRAQRALEAHLESWMNLSALERGTIDLPPSVLGKHILGREVLYAGPHFVLLGKKARKKKLTQLERWVLNKSNWEHECAMRDKTAHLDTHPID